MGSWIALGLGFGTVLGIAVFDSLAQGIAFGLPIGVICGIFYGGK
jgi:hypothetical protein